MTSYQAEIYDRYVSTTFAHRNDLSREGVARSAENFFREFGAYLPAGKAEPILEIGCGHGGFLLCCRQQGYADVSGVDISPEQVDFCHKLGFGEVVCSDALSYLRGSDRQFGLIVMSDVLEHLPKDQVLAVLKAINDHLRPGGRVVLRVPNMSNPFNLRTRYVDFSHESGFSRESLEQVLRVSGLEVERVYGAFTPHPRFLVRLVFERLLWRAFLLFYRHTMHLSHEVVRGKNLIGVAIRPR
jgi:SAM-dependent methyltransferase